MHNCDGYQGGLERVPGGACVSILLVDDEPGLRDLIAEVLRDEGFCVLAASDGQSALALLREHGQVDLLISDLGLPYGMNGRQLAGAVREVLPALPVVFITGNLAFPLPEGGSGPHTEIMEKPFALMDLVGRAKSILARGGLACITPG